MRLFHCSFCFLSLFACLCGCQPANSPEDFRPFAAAIVAVQGVTIDRLPDNVPPTPSPSTRCENCQGSGKLGDGRVVVPCPVCEGTGKTKEPPPLKELPAAPNQTAPAMPRVQCLIFTCPACPPCHALRTEIEQQLPPVGWLVGESADRTIRFVREEADATGQTDQFDIHTWPTLVLLVDGQERERIVGRISARELSQRMVVLQKGLRSDVAPD